MSQESSGTRSYLPYWLSGMIALLLLGGLLVRLAVSYYQGGYTWAESDWDSDGSTSLIEYLDGSEVGDASVCVSGQRCTRYFRLKDGMDIKTKCPARIPIGRGKYHIQRDEPC